MKRSILALILAGVLALGGCSGTAPNEADTTADSTVIDTAADTTAPETEREEIVITPIERPEPVADRTAYVLEDGWTYLGTGVGYNPGRVVSVHDADAFTWNGTGYWYLDKNFDTYAVEEMVRQSILELAGTDDLTLAFDRIFTEFNLRVNGEAVTYSPGQKIAIKINMNVTGTSANSANSAKGYYPSPITLRSLLTVLVEYGIEPVDITVYDASRTFPTYLIEYCSKGELADVNFVYLNLGGENDAVADTTKPVEWSFDIANDGLPDYGGYPTYNTTYYPTCVTEADYLINLSCLRGHNLSGFTASGKNHFGTIMPGYTESDGSISFPDKFRTNPPSWSGVHKYVSARNYKGSPSELWDLPTRPYGTYNALVDLLSNVNGGGKTVLYLCDGLAATENQGATLATKHKWYTFSDVKGKQEWPCTILVSQDPIALDSVALDYISAERAEAIENGNNSWNGSLPDDHTADNYLIEAALAYDPPSGTVYRDGNGNPITSLGVHEHWNNPEDKEYTGNTTPGVGIEHIVIER